MCVLYLWDEHACNALRAVRAALSSSCEAYWRRIELGPRARLCDMAHCKGVNHMACHTGPSWISAASQLHLGCITMGAAHRDFDGLANDEQLVGDRIL